MRTSKLSLAGLALVAASAAIGNAHECGPDRITTYVNRRAYFQIKADVSESQATAYSLFNNSDPAIASVNPILPFTSFRSALWVITGNTVGTSFAAFHWSYAPNNAAGDCLLEIDVLPESSAPPRTAANHPNSTHGGDPINYYTGELILQEEPDLNLGGPMPLYFSRYYASGMTRDGQMVSGLGNNWSHNFDYRLSHIGNFIDVITCRGRVISFEKLDTGWILRSSSVVPFQLIEVGTDFRFLDPQDNHVYTFNGAGQLTSISDGKGNHHDLTYSGPAVASVTDGLGRQLTFTYFSHNQLGSVSDGTRTVFFGYTFDALEALSSVFTADNQFHSYVYGGTPTTGPLLLRHVMPEGNYVTTQTYDDSARVIAQSFAPGSTNTIAYQPGVTIVTDPLGNTRRFEFDSNGALTRAVDEDGKEILYTYDADGRRSSIIDRRGGVTQFAWHSPSGRIATVIYPNQTSNAWTYASHALDGLAVWEQSSFTERDGAVESVTLNSLGQVTERIDPAGFHWKYSYNAQNQLLTEINPAGGGTTNEYNADGTLASISDSNGKRTSSYDSFRRVVQETNPDGSTRGVGYDNADRQLRLTNELGGVYVYNRDRNGRVAKQVDPEGNTWTYNYDSSDRATAVGDSSGVTQFSFTPRGELATMIDPAGANFAYKYDRVGNLTEITDPMGRTWKRTYGPESVLTGVIDPAGRTNSYESDLIGRFTKVTDALNRVRQYSYDGVGRTLGVNGPEIISRVNAYDIRGEQISSAVGSSGVSAKYAYDALGSMTNVIDPRGNAWRNEFDSYGQLTGRVDPLGNRRDYQIDSRHRPNHVTFPNNLGSADISFDGTGAVIRRKYSDGVQLDYANDKRGWLKSANGLTLARNLAGYITNCNGVAIARSGSGQIQSVTVAPGKMIQFEYSNGYELRRITDWLGGVTEVQYDTNGFPVSMTRPNGVVSSVNFDALGEIVSLQEGALSSIDVQRGADGQVLKSHRKMPLATNPTQPNVSRSFDAASQVNGFSYDALGRLVSDSRRSYTWDLAGRLLSYTEAGVTVKMEYDAFSRRTARIANSATNSFVWNYAYRLPAISVEQLNGADLRYYVHTPEGLLLYSIDAASGARTHYHFDEAGNVVFLTDDQQNVIAAYSYGPYGEPLSVSGTSDNHFTSQGRFGVMKEGESGLYYMQARYYDSDTGRFLRRDPLPLTSADALNPYQYAFGNPALYTDPNGLTPTTLSSKPTPPPPPPPPPPHVVTDTEFKTQVRIMKNKLWDSLSRSRAGVFDLSVPGAFDSYYFQHVGEMFSWRGHVMNGGELNYYFQGMYWKEATGSRGAMYAAIYAWKRCTKYAYGYGGVPSANDLFAANQGFDDTNSFAEELASDVITIVEDTVGAPQGSVNGWIGPGSTIGSIISFLTPGNSGGFVPGTASPY